MRYRTASRPLQPGNRRQPRLSFLRQPRFSIRSRLTLLYGGLFLIAGGILIAILYIIFTTNFPGGHLAQGIFPLAGRQPPPSGPRLTQAETVTTRAVAEGGMVELEVSNSGPLVPPEQADTLFEPFRRLDGNRTSHPHGAGLGLSIVRSVVQTHGGQLAAAARDGGGVIIQVRLAATSPNG